MDKYLSVAKMIEVEKASNAAGYSYPMMMAQAGRSLANEILQVYSSFIDFPTVLGLVGSGNNGGDTLVAMQHLAELGWSCTAYLTADRNGDPLLDGFQMRGGVVIQLTEDKDYMGLLSALVKTDILLDGLLGTGIQLPLRSPVKNVLTVVRDFIERGDSDDLIVVAVDCPSGIDCESGEAADVCLHADLTVCMAAVKQGMLKFPAFEYLGELVVGDIGLDPDLPVWSEVNRFVLNQVGVEAVLPSRPMNSHKGTFGTAMVVGGSDKYPGALILAGEAAFRSGAGWVEIAVPKSLHPCLAGSFREATWLPLPDNGQTFTRYAIAEFLESAVKADAVLVGPGVGMTEDSQNFIHGILPEIEVPLVLDADGLKLAASLPDWHSRLHPRSVLTPHPGEMSILTGHSVYEIQENRINFAENFARDWGHIVVLKGAFTVVADPGGPSAILPVATPALARAGSGDVLAGLITGLVAQGMSGYDAACAGVWLHAQAGLMAANNLGSTAGVLAGDIITEIPGVMIW